MFESAEAERLHPFLNSPLAFLPIDLVQHERELDVLPNRLPRKEQAALRKVSRGRVTPLDPPGVARLKAKQDTEKRRLPASRWAEKGNSLPATDVKGEAVENREPAVALGEPFDV